MTPQIAVRLDDELVEFIDAEVASGRSASRAALVTRAVRQEQRRRLAERDAAVLAATRDGDTADLATLAEYASRRPMDID